MLPLTVSGQPLEISLERLGQPMSLYVPLSKRTQSCRRIWQSSAKIKIHTGSMALKCLSRFCASPNVLSCLGINEHPVHSTL